MEIFTDPARFKVAALGRRTGKSYLAATSLLVKALEKNDKPVLYCAPTIGQAQQIIWKLLHDLGHEVITNSHVNSSYIDVANGNRIYIRGADRPDTMRGLGLRYVVMDEAADIKESVWSTILRPSLTDVKGEALIIGTPKGKANWFYDSWVYATKGGNPQWSGWQANSKNNPFLDPVEIEAARESMSSFHFRQEYEADFTNPQSDIFKEEWIKVDDDGSMEPENGDHFIAVDLAGFETQEKTDNKKWKKKIDQSAIAVVKICDNGVWYVKDILHGRWDIRETAVKILKAAKDYRAMAVGIEKGSLKAAVMPYLEDKMRQLGFYPRIMDVTHGNQKKYERIVWALQGRMEHGRVIFKEGPYVQEVKNELFDFPSEKAHDDLIDALAYIDQVGSPLYGLAAALEDDGGWEPFDTTAGY